MEERFNPDEWVFERSSGYAGERNTRTDEWIHENEYYRRKCEYVENKLWEDEVFRIIKLHTRSNSLSEAIVNDLKKSISISQK